MDYFFLVTVLRVTEDSMVLLIFERRAMVWVIDDYVLAYLGDTLDWRTINVGRFGAWLLTWMENEMKICA